MPSAAAAALPSPSGSGSPAPPSPLPGEAAAAFTSLRRLPGAARRQAGRRRMSRRERQSAARQRRSQQVKRTCGAETRGRREAGTRRHNRALVEQYGNARNSLHRPGSTAHCRLNGEARRLPGPRQKRQRQQYGHKHIARSRLPRAREHLHVARPKRTTPHAHVGKGRQLRGIAQKRPRTAANAWTRRRRLNAAGAAHARIAGCMKTQQSVEGRQRAVEKRR